MHTRAITTCDCAFGRHHHDGVGRKARVARVLGVGVAAGAVALSMVVSSAPEASAKRKDVEIIAHRGGEDVGPEHTLKTLRKAIKLGADAVEIDVRFSKDHVPVLMHDASLDRTTDCDGRVSNRTLRELRRCNAGFDDDDHDERIPTLRQALRLIAKSKAGVYIHVKESKHARHYKDVVRELDRFHLNDGLRAVTMADRKSVLRQLKKAGSKRLGLVFNSRAGWNERYDVLIAYNTPLRKDLVSRAQRRGQIVLAVQDHGMSLRDLAKGRSNIDGFLANRLKDALKKLD